MAEPGFWQRLLGLGRDRDGENALLERQALQLAPAGTEALQPAPRRRPLAHPPLLLLQEQVAGKLLHGWLQNRHQTLFPLALNLRNMPPAHRALLVRAMAAGVAMTGQDGATRLLPTIGGDAEDAALLQQDAGPLPPLLDELREARLGAHAYAATLLLVGTAPTALGQAWLDYLSARFALPVETTADLQRRSGRRRLRPAAR